VTTVLDGGLATELEARGHDLSDRLWSARLLLSEPDAIEEVHLAYFRAGARVAITASYQASLEGFEAAGLDRATALQAIRRSVELAQGARRRFLEEEAAAVGRDPGRVLVAGSVGPYGAMLADGSEYRGDYDPGDAALSAFHRPRIDALVAAGADLLAVETIPTVREARVLVKLLDETGVPAWISYTGRDGATTAAGEPFAEAIALAGSGRDVVAVGVNCTAPQHVRALLKIARTSTARPLIAYPNRGDTWNPESRTWRSDRAGTWEPAVVASWTALGADWLGGCCGTRPADIERLAGAVAALA
jgi:homocysteine S-methyltransferase